METKAERLKWLRKYRSRITLEELAKKVGLSKATVQRYENGIITNIPSDKIELLAEALETSPGFIMGWENDPDKYRLDNRFGILLKKEREKSKMTRAEFAKEIGLTEETLERYENGTVIPGINVAFPIMFQLGISAEEYDPVATMPHETQNEQIIRLFSGLSDLQKVRAIAYIQGMLDSEDKQ